MSPQRNLAVDKGSIGLDRSKVCENELANYGRRVERNETILETTKIYIVDPTSFFKRQTKICDNKKLTSALPNLTSSSKQEQTKTKSATKKVDLTSSKADSSSLTCWSFVCSSLCFLFNTFKSKSESQNDHLQADCTSILISVSFTFFLRLSLSVSTPFEILNGVRSLSSFLSWLDYKVIQHLR